jgi:hypothetical protein
MFTLTLSAPAVTKIPCSFSIWMKTKQQVANVLCVYSQIASFHGRRLFIVIEIRESSVEGCARPPPRLRRILISLESADEKMLRAELAAKSAFKQVARGG